MVPSRDDWPERLRVGIHAVYALCWKGEVVYVGQSKGIHTRIASHWNSYQRWRNGKPLKPDLFVIEFDNVWLKYCHETQANNLEWAMIQKYHPKYNVMLKRPDPIEVEVRNHRMTIDLDRLGLSRWTRDSKRSSQGFARRV
jgi:hypothetical protein